jgi:protein tyrosine phosphatase type IVA
VHDVVRVCEPTYHPGELENAGIVLHEMGYQDGTSPSPELIENWLSLVDTIFGIYKKKTSPTPSTTTPPNGSTSLPPSSSPASNGNASNNNNNNNNNNTRPCVAVHCVAGLGRAPVLVAIALVEFAGMDPVEAVAYIRQRRRGAINEKQLLYLEGYRKRYKKNTSSGGAGGSGGGGCCVIL